MKNKEIRVASIILVVVIIIQILLVHPGIALNNLSALGVPFALIELFWPTENLITGEYIEPTNFYSSVCTALHAEHTTRSVLTGKQLDYSYDIEGEGKLQAQCLNYLLIWLFVFLEIRTLIRHINQSSRMGSILILIAAALSVNICAEIIYLIFGFVNAIVSYGITYILFTLINSKLEFSSD